MRFRPIFLPLLALLAFSYQAFSQKLTDAVFRDTLIHFYRLDSAQLSLLQQSREIPDDPRLLTHPLRDLPEQAPYSLPDGTYLTAKINERTLLYQFLQIAPFSQELVQVGSENVLYLRDRQRRLIKDARLTAGTVLIPYDSGFGGYRIDDSLLKRTGLNLYEPTPLFLNVRCLGVDYRIRCFVPPPPVKQEPDRRRTRVRAEGVLWNDAGYLVSDKPIYRPGDSMRIKAFFYHHKDGRPFTGKVRLTIVKNESPLPGEQPFSLTRELEPEHPGAFVFGWQIPDSLPPDRTFTITALYTDQKVSYKEELGVRLQDYELAKSTYAVTMPERTLYANDDAQLFFEASDRNGFPVEWTRVHYKMSILSLDSLQSDTLRLSAERRENWYEKDTVMGYEKFLEQRIPSSVFPRANGKYQVEATLTDPINFEQRSFTATFEKYAQAENIRFYQRGDTLHAHVLRNGQDSVRTLSLTLLGANREILFKGPVVTPLRYPLNGREVTALLADGDKQIGDLQLQYFPLEMMRVKGVRNADSFLISFAHAFPLPVYYRVYRQGRLVRQGEQTRLSLQLPDASLSEYRVLLSSDLQDNLLHNFYELTFLPQAHQLRFEHNLPESAFPGERIAVQLKVTDFRQQPVRDADVAAFAINSAFAERMAPPVFRIPEAYREETRIAPVRVIPLAVELLAGSRSLPLEARHVERYRLRRNEYYQLLYPTDQLTAFEIPKQQPAPEFSVILSDHAQLYIPPYVLLDGAPLFHLSLNRTDIYSYPTTPGPHRLSFRYFDRLYTIDSFTMKPNRKYVLSVSPAGNTRHQTLRITDSLPFEEMTAAEKDLLYPRLLITSGTTTRRFSAAPADSTFRYRNAGTGYTQRIGFDEVRIDGPFAPNSEVKVQVDTNNFRLRTGTDHYYAYDGLNRDFIRKTFDTAQLHFWMSARLVDMYAVTALAEPDTVATPQPVTVPIYATPAPNIPIGKQEPEPYNFFQEHAPTEGPGSFRLLVSTGSPDVFVKAVWLICKERFESSLYHTYNNRQFTIDKSDTEQKYDIYLLYSNNRMLRLRNQRFRDGDHFYINTRLLPDEPFTLGRITEPLKIYSELFKTPLLPFIDPPPTLRQAILRVHTAPRRHIYFHGVLAGSDGDPLDGALVYAEQNGVFRYGGITNANGLFEILNMEPGTYNILIYSGESGIVRCAPARFENGGEYLLSASLPGMGSNDLIQLAAQGDFNLLSSGTQHRTLSVELFDKQSRDLLDGWQAELYDRNDRLLQRVVPSGGKAVFSVENYDRGGYRVQVRKDRYATLEISGMRFDSARKYTLQGFIGLASIELTGIKRYRLDFAGPNEGSHPTVFTDVRKGSIEGTITDEFNEVLVNAYISVFENGGTLKGTATSDLDGKYSVQPLHPGTYDVVIKALNKKEVRISYVHVPISGGIVQLNQQLEPKRSSLLETVTITKEKPIIDSGGSSVNTYSNAEIGRLPTRTPTDAATLTPGAVQSNSGSNFSLGGARSTGTLYYVDGVQVNGSNGVNLPPASIDGYGSYGSERGSRTDAYLDKQAEREIFVDENMLQRALSMPNLGVLRKSFSDVGFWEPSLRTDENGLAHFTVRLPDNVASYRAYLLGGAEDWKHGTDSALVRLYKPLQAISVLPRYLYQGDRVLARIRYANLTREPAQVRTRLAIDDSERPTRQLTLVHSLADSVWLQAGNRPELIFEGGLVYQERYRDVERINVPIHSPALTLTESRSFLLDRDTTFRLSILPGAKGYLELSSNLYERIVQSAEELNRYGYGCVEQTSSKLRALVVQQRLRRLIGQQEGDKALSRDIRRMLDLLRGMQQPDGSFSWWKQGTSDPRMTVYAMEAAREAHLAGYSDRLYESVRAYVANNVRRFSPSDALYAYSILLRDENSRGQNFLDWWRQLKQEDLPVTDRITYFKVKQLSGDTIRPTELRDLMESIYLQAGNEYHGNFFYDAKADFFQLYGLFRNTPYGPQLSAQFRRQLLSGQFEQNLNTYSKARMIEALVEESLADSVKSLLPEVRIDRRDPVRVFPARFPIADTAYTIKHSGGDVFLRSVEERVVTAPAAHDSFYRLRTYLIQGGRRDSSVQSGKPCELVAEVYAFRSGEQVMLELPVPSGFRLAQADDEPGQAYTHREYRDGRLTYFFNRLPAGGYRIKARLMPVFPGSFVLPPARISLMYYPYLFGNTAQRRVGIR